MFAFSKKECEGLALQVRNEQFEYAVLLNPRTVVFRVYSSFVSVKLNEQWLK